MLDIHWVGLVPMGFYLIVLVLVRWTIKRALPDKDERSAYQKKYAINSNLTDLFTSLLLIAGILLTLSFVGYSGLPDQIYYWMRVVIMLASTILSGQALFDLLWGLDDLPKKYQ